jgi:hypothetical protein
MVAALMAFAISLISSPAARAQSRGAGGATPGVGFYFDETFFPVYVSKVDTSSVTDSSVPTESGWGFDTRTTLGYAFWDTLLVGLTYNYYHLKTARPNVPGGTPQLDETTTHDEFGPTIGYVQSGWRALLTVFVGGKKIKKTVYSGTEESNVTLTNKSISGFQLTAGYAFHLFSSIEIGPSLVYRSVSYSKQSNENALNSGLSYTDTTLYSKASESTLSPMISVVARF